MSGCATSSSVGDTGQFLCHFCTTVNTTFVCRLQMGEVLCVWSLTLRTRLQQRQPVRQDIRTPDRVSDSQKVMDIADRRLYRITSAQSPCSANRATGLPNSNELDHKNTREKFCLTAYLRSDVAAVFAHLTPVPIFGVSDCNKVQSPAHR